MRIIQRIGIPINEINIAPCSQICDMNRGQPTTPRESRIPDGSNRIGYGYGGQAGATCESIASDSCHGIGDGHRGQTAAIIEFANRFISTSCNLNGRKVMT